MGSCNALEPGQCQRTVEGENKMKAYSYQLRGIGTNIEEASVDHWYIASVWVRGLFTS